MQIGSDTGEFNKDFEKELSDYTGIKHIHLTNSGSSAILVAIKSLIHQGGTKARRFSDSPLTTFATSISSAIDFGVILFLWRQNHTHMLLIPEEVERAIKKYPKLRVLSRLIEIPESHSQPLEIDSLLKIAATHWDVINGKHVGSFGTAAAFSFYGSHHITAAGVGGAFRN